MNPGHFAEGPIGDAGFPEVTYPEQLTFSAADRKWQTVTQQGQPVSAAEASIWIVTYLGTTDRGTRGSIYYSTLPGKTVLRLPSPLSIRTAEIRPFGCTTDEGEPLLVRQSIYRDATGEVVEALGYSGLQRTGGVTTADTQDALPELEFVGWELGCRSCSGPQAGSNIGRLIIRVDGGAEQTVDTSKSWPVRIHGHDYSFEIRGAPLFGTCGIVEWWLRRNDLFEDAPLDGSAFETPDGG